MQDCSKVFIHMWHYLDRNDLIERAPSTLHSKIWNRKYPRNPPLSLLIQEFSKSRPEQAAQVKMIVAQLYLNQGKVYQACDALKTLGDDAYRPGVVSCS